MSQDAVSVDGAFITVSTDINIGPSNVAVTASLSGLFFTDTPDSAFSGISGFTTQDPNTGAPSETDLSQGSFFNSTPILFASNAIVITFVTGGIAAGSSGWPVSVDNSIHVSGACQVFFDMP